MRKNLILKTCALVLALLMALCTPNALLKKLQDESNFTELMVMQEDAKLLPFEDVWAKYCEECGVAANNAWYAEVKKYEEEVLSKR